MDTTLAPLPYDREALAPHISAETIDYHYGKHHQAYLTNLLGLVEDSAWADASLEDLIRDADGAVFNNAAQVYNHSFYWQCMRPGGGGTPEGAVADALTATFGSYAAFRERFATAAATQFGSGWAWLATRGDQLEIVKTANADNPLRNGLKPVLTIDVWEHAYYIDYRNARPRYIETWLDRLVNWDFVAERLRV